MKLFTENKRSDWKRIVFLSIAHTFSSEDIVNKDTLKMIFISDGQGEMVINDEPYPFNAPLLITLNPSDKFSFTKTNNLTLKVLYFHPAVINDAFQFDLFINQDIKEKIGSTLFQDALLLSPFFDIEGAPIKIIYPSLDISFRFEDLLKKMEAELINQPSTYWPCRSRSYFLELLFLVNSTIHRSPIEPSSTVLTKNETVLAMIRYLSTNLNQKITVSDLEKKFGYNRNIINELFMKETNSTVINFLINSRINFASSLLRETYLPVEEIALRVGFSDASYFQKVFKKKLGISPSKYREQFL